MKRLRKIYLIIAVFFTVFSVIFSASSYRIDSLDITAKIQEDGSVVIEEIALYNASEINGVLYNIDAKGYGKLQSLEVFYEKNGEFISAVNDRGTASGMYTVSVSDELYKIKLYSPMRNEKRYFGFRYVLPRGVTVYEDIAQFNRKMVGRGWQNSIRDVSVKVILPKEADKDKIHAFGHGPLTGNIEILNGREIFFTLKNYRPGEFVETNILFPKEIVSKINPSYVKKTKGYDSIMAMEGKLAEESNRERDRAVRGMILGRVVFFGGVAWWLFLMVFIYLKNGKKYKVINPYGEYFRELPDDYTPAVAGTLVSRKMYPAPTHLFATVMDLVRKDYLEMEEINEVNSKGKNIKKTILKKVREVTSELKDYERLVFKWYINELGDGEKVVLEDVEKYVSKNLTNAKKFNANFEKWKTLVYTDMLSKGLKQDKRNKLAVALGVITGILLFIGGMVLIVIFQDPKFMLFNFLGIPLIVFSAAVNRPSKEKEEAYSRWKAFKKFLVDYSNLEEAKLASIHLWEHYFVYAIALGVAEKVAAGYKKIAVLRGEDDVNLRVGRNRMSLMNTYLYSRAFRTMESSTVKAAARSMSEVAKSTRSSSSGSMLTAGTICISPSLARYFFRIPSSIISRRSSIVISSVTTSAA
ncbi:DUF2207 family protein, partial [Fusobacterium ulcerans]|uniref:DUF2207 family protein n=1 Tax=Fusobacterium ulcerans TaxID=861 RepID=UPI002E7835F7